MVLSGSAIVAQNPPIESQEQIILAILNSCLVTFDPRRSPPSSTSQVPNILTPLHPPRNTPIISQNGRQTPRPTTTRVPPSPLRRHRKRRHDKVRIHIQHCARLSGFVYWTPAVVGVYEYWAWTTEGEDEDTDVGEDDTACWESAGGE